MQVPGRGASRVEGIGERGMLSVYQRAPVVDFIVSITLFDKRLELGKICFDNRTIAPQAGFHFIIRRLAVASEL